MCDLHKTVMDGSLAIHEADPEAKGTIAYIYLYCTFSGEYIFYRSIFLISFCSLALFPFWNVLAGVKFLGDLLHIIREERDRRSDDLTVVDKVIIFPHQQLRLLCLDLTTVHGYIITIGGETLEEVFYANSCSLISTNANGTSEKG